MAKDLGKDDKFLDQVRIAAKAEADAEPEHPEYVEIDGTKYVRQDVATNPAKQRPGTKEGYSWITINIAPHADRIRIDNTYYFQGHSYEVRDDQVPTFEEIMFNTWRHERATGGANVTNQSAMNLSFNRGVQSMHRGAPGVPGV